VHGSIRECCASRAGQPDAFVVEHRGDERLDALEVPLATGECVGIDGDISTASLKAVVSAVNRAIRTEVLVPA